MAIRHGSFLPLALLVHFFIGDLTFSKNFHIAGHFVYTNSLYYCTINPSSLLLLKKLLFQKKDFVFGLEDLIFYMDVLIL